MRAERITGPVAFQPIDAVDRRSRNASSQAHGAVKRHVWLIA